MLAAVKDANILLAYWLAAAAARFYDLLLLRQCMCACTACAAVLFAIRQVGEVAGSPLGGLLYTIGGFPLPYLVAGILVLIVYVGVCLTLSRQ